jgi:hypothetical protein
LELKEEKKKSSGSHHNISATENERTVSTKTVLLRSGQLFADLRFSRGVLETSHGENARDEGIYGHKEFCSSGLEKKVFF